MTVDEMLFKLTDLRVRVGNVDVCVTDPFGELDLQDIYDVSLEENKVNIVVKE